MVCIMDLNVNNKVILYRSCIELSPLVQCTTCPFWPVQSCNFKKLKVYKTKQLKSKLPNHPKPAQISYSSASKKGPSQNFIRLTLVSNPCTCSPVHLLRTKPPIRGLCRGDLRHKISFQGGLSSSNCC